MMPLWFVGIAIICPIEIDYEAEPDAGPNDEERGQPHVPNRTAPARTSSSVSFAFGGIAHLTTAKL